MSSFPETYNDPKKFRLYWELNLDLYDDRMQHSIWRAGHCNIPDGGNDMNGNI